MADGCLVCCWQRFKKMKACDTMYPASSSCANTRDKKEPTCKHIFHQAEHTLYARRRRAYSLCSHWQRKLKPYFKLENVIQGAFTVANKLFGLEFKQVDTIDVYHPDVKTYEVFDENNQLISIFYADFHPREGKRNGAWMKIGRAHV